MSKPLTHQYSSVIDSDSNRSSHSIRSDERSSVGSSNHSDERDSVGRTAVHTDRSSSVDQKKPAPIQKSLSKKNLNFSFINSNEFKAAHLGFSFALLYVAFNVAQANLTSIFPEIGIYTFGLIYIFFAIGSILAPEVASVLGLKWAMVSGSACFTLFITSFNLGKEWIVFVSAGLTGIGQGLMWINQGVWIAELNKRVEKERHGYIIGVFFSLVAINSVLGNIISLVILEAGSTTTVMLWSMVAISALGTATMALVDPLTKPPLPQQPNIPNSKKLLKSPAPQRVLSKTQSLLEILSSQHSITVPDPPTKKTTMGRLREIKNVASERSTLLLVMFLFNQGLNCAYSFTVLTAYVPDAWDSSRKSSLLAEIFLSIGVASIIFSFLTGILYDKFGWKPLIAINLLGTIMCIAQLIIGFDLNLWGSTPPLEFLIANLVIGGFVLSASSTASNSLINIALSAYGERSPGAFGVYRVLFCLGMVIGSLIFRFLNRTVCSVINLVILLGGCWMYTINKAENEAKSKNSQTNTNAPAVKLEKEPSFVIKSSMIKKSSAFESEMV